MRVHFGWVAATAAWAASRAGDVEYTVQLHAFEIHDRRYIDRFTPLPLHAAARVDVISERDRRTVADRWHVSATVMRMGVPESWIVAEPAPRDLRMAVVASLVPKKGHHVLFDALARAQTKWHVEVIGDGVLRSSLEERVRVLGLTAQVEFLGRLPEVEVRRHLERAAVACLPCVETWRGDRDGIPVALIEAMACGATVLTTRVGAISELVEGAGVMVASGDSHELAAALDRLADPAERSRWTEPARRRVTEGWTVEAGATRLLADFQTEPRTEEQWAPHAVV